MLRRSIQPTWSSGLLFISLWLDVARADTYEIHKISMTGDAAPGLTETFRFYRSVHMIPDGTVAFAGVTTRTGNPWNTQPRGVYLSRVPGPLITAAEIDDTEAYLPIGLPNTWLDSNSAKTLAFDFLEPLDLSLQEVIAVKVFGAEIQPLTPTNDTTTLVWSELLPTGQFYEGRFESDLSGLVLNESCQVLFSVSFCFQNEPNVPVPGIFQADVTNGVRNVAFAGDAVPGLADATFDTFGFINQAENGTALFSANLTGEGAPSGSRNSLWMERDGIFSLVLREGSPAPGLPGFVVVTTGGASVAYVDVQGDSTVVFSAVTDPGAGTTYAYWVGNTSEPSLDLFLWVDSTPNLNDPSAFTVTDQGNVVFTTVNHSSMQLDASGAVYFEGEGRFANEETVAGIWKRDPDGTISLLVPWDFINGLYQLALLDVSDDGHVLLLGKRQSTKGLWVRSPQGTLNNVVYIGDMLEQRKIVFIPDFSSVSALGDHRFHDLFSTEGDFVFVAQFDDADGDGYPDEGVFVGRLTDRFDWAGECGSSNWHCGVANWDDAETGEDASVVPGSADGTEEVTIQGAHVQLTDKPVHLAVLTATGSLTVEQPLTLEQTSYIESLTLRDKLTANGELSLAGHSEWLGGSLSGDGEVDLLAGASLLISPTLGSSDLYLPLEVEGEVTQRSATLNLQGDYGMITVLSGGEYLIDTGSIVDFGENVRFLNQGRLIKDEGGTFTLDAYFENDRGGIVEVYGGILLVTDPTTWAGELFVQRGAQVEFRNTQVNLGDITGSVFAAHGYGTVLLSDSLCHVGTDTEVLFQLEEPDRPARLEIAGATEINGSGLLYTAGKILCTAGTISAPVNNEGDWEMSGGTISGVLTNRGTFSFEGERLEGTLVNHEDFSINGGSVSGDFENHGFLFVSQSGGGSPPDLSGLVVSNLAGAAFTVDSTTTTASAVNNDGVIIVHDATLRVEPGDLKNTGQLTGKGMVQGEVINNGRLSPGESFGTLTVDGDYTQSSQGTLEIEVGGDQSGVDHDQLAVTGTAALDGTVRVIIADGYLPPSGTELRIVQCGSVAGAFGEVTVENSSTRLKGETVSDAAGILLRITHLVLPSFPDWQTASFSPVELTNPAVSGADGNPDGDRFVNALEYVFDLRPTLADANPFSFGVERDGVGEPQAITLSFPWAKGMTDARYEVRKSLDLKNWEPIAVEVAEIKDLGTHDQLTLKAILSSIERDEAAYVELIITVTPQ